jgi:hypothetical protein
LENLPASHGVQISALGPALKKPATQGSHKPSPLLA